MKPISIHDYLWDPAKYPAKPVCVVYGDDRFLRSHAVRHIRNQVLDSDDAEFSLCLFEGNDPKLEFKDVLRELQTAAMFGGCRRVVRVDEADKFVANSKNREALENYFTKPSERSVLILQLNSFDARTSLFKKAAESGLLIEIKFEKKTNGQIDEKKEEKKRQEWVVQWSKHHHKTPCDPAAAEMIIQRMGLDYGLLDQELAKLALMVTNKKGITPELVEQTVGSWRSRTVWDMWELVLEGKTTAAIRQLDTLILAGEEPQKIIGVFAENLAQFASATELILNAERQGNKITVRSALEKSGALDKVKNRDAYVQRFVLDAKEKQLLRLGRHRGTKLADWLLQLDLDLKGGSRSDSRLLLETFIVKLSSAKYREG
ncbi:MAG: DNA polymerase III subunit delta [Planctomycetaceae bacterium]|jgi:DNA polymerase-3 subunit delta|nr:DNA polymerase III subunit delta [Planctomycetaceae bacterium]